MQATIIGNLGKDSEVTTTKNGKTFLKFSIADTVGFGENKKTQWVNCTDFRQSSVDKLKQYLLKGTKVVVFGEVSLNEYETNDGVTKTSLQCVVNNIVLVGSSNKETSAPSKKDNSTNFADDDIPF